MTRFLVLLLLPFLSGAAFGKTFECTEAFETILEALVDENPEVLVVATISADGKSGTIEVADTTFNAEYQVEGFDRAWRFFTGKGQKFGYLFLIQPDGTASYYDHETSQGEPTSPDQVYFCHEMKIEVATPEKSEGERAQALDEDELAAYQFAIAQKIRRNWAVPASAGTETRCSARVKQRIGGEVVGVNIIDCNGDESVRRSVEAAIRRSSPLPEPSDPDLFHRELILNLTLER
jgi:hypothetical protein